MPDRIERAAGVVQASAHELVDEVKKERAARVRFERRAKLMAVGVVVALIAIVCLILWNRSIIDRAEEERAKDDRQAEVDLHERLCAAWSNRIDDHATLTDYLASFVGSSERGAEFVDGLRDAYERSDAKYARERGLTKENCLG